jgi:hypothetical protein
MNTMILKITIIFVMIQGIAFADPVLFSNMTITSINSYSEYGGGDVIIYGSTGVTGCNDGIWLSQSDSGFKANMAILMMVYANNKFLNGYIDTSQLWSGSGVQKICRSYLLTLTR